MAIDLGSETQTISKQERTWRVNIETPRDTDPTVTVFREKVQTSPDGSVVYENNTINRSLSATAEQSFTVNDKTYTTGEIAQVISAIADTWAQEDANVS